MTAQSERTAKSVFHDPQLRYPGQYADAQLRTLQRRVMDWRSLIVLTFDEQWLREELLIGQTLPPPLQTLVEPAVEVS